jgi:trehalose 6-phosphate synthase/phosphatase
MVPIRLGLQWEHQGDGMAVNRLVVVSNRLPVAIRRIADGDWSVQRGSGGLVTALAPVLRDRGGLWIGWSGATGLHSREVERILRKRGVRIGYALKAIELSEEEIAKYYHGFSNEILWPLFHDFPSACNFDPGYWPVYQRVNNRLARAIVKETTEDDYVWIQDYHLIPVARELRHLGVRRPIGYFHHIPFPPLDILLKLPWRFQILEALLDYDLVGFQTTRDRRNFFNCVRRLFPGTRASDSRQVSWLTVGERKIRVGAFPISIDFCEFARVAESKAVADLAWSIHEKLPEQQIILGVDRLDYTKGIPEKIKAYALALERYPEMRRNATLVQVVVPSRIDVEEYGNLRQEIEQLVGRVNGRFTEAGWAPIQYIFRSLAINELVAFYRTSEIALLTPLKDGMNLVAKEFCACSLEENSVLILSEFAGAAAQLKDGAILVNPHDISGTADAIARAWRMGRIERQEKMHRLRRICRHHDIFRWVRSFLHAAIAKDLEDFPPAVDYFPKRAEARME